MSQMHVERFVYPSETSGLTDEEYATALRCLDWVDSAIALRSKLSIERGAAFDLHLPAGNWSPAVRQNLTLDQSTTNPFTSFDLLRSRNRDVIRNLRLYSQAFTGYQLATLEMAHSRPWITKPLPANLDAIISLLAHPSIELLQTWARIAAALPPHLNMSPPWKFGEMGWLVDGRIVNYDTWCYLQRIALLHESGVIDSLAALRSPRVVEIGPGYGALAHYLTAINPSIRYVGIDLPESLAFSSVYLSALHPERVTLAKGADAGIALYPNFLAEEALRGGADVVINTISFNEMTEPQVAFYRDQIASALGRDGVLFEHNAETNHNGVRSSLSEILARRLTPVTRIEGQLFGTEIDPPRAILWRPS